MSFSGRVIGGILVAIALFWILGLAGIFPFGNLTNNQISQDQFNGETDRPPVSDPNASRVATSDLGTTPPPAPSPSPSPSPSPIENGSNGTTGAGGISEPQPRASNGSAAENNNGSGNGTFPSEQTETSPPVRAAW